MKEFDLLVFIGRFQPLHIGHLHVIKQALEKSDRLLILVGSSNVARSVRNPFTFADRSIMITDSIGPYLKPEDGYRILIDSLDDMTYNDTAWISQVQSRVDEVARPNDRIGLIGHAKDHSSYYLKLFPNWGSVNVIQDTIFSATDIRDRYFQLVPQLPFGVCPEAVVDYLSDFLSWPAFARLLEEGIAVRTYHHLWRDAPFPPTFVCVDNVVVQSGHILLVTRGDQPGKGLLALPGGFLNVKETLIDSAVRELKEETRIADHIGEIPPAKLRSFITKEETFDDPNRSSRGRTITTAYLYELPPAKPMYTVRGDDDALDAKWYPIGTVSSDKFFEDHYFIIQKMLGLNS